MFWNPWVIFIHNWNHKFLRNKWDLSHRFTWAHMLKKTILQVTTQNHEFEPLPKENTKTISLTWSSTICVTLPPHPNSYRTMFSTTCWSAVVWPLLARGLLLAVKKKNSPGPNHKNMKQQIWLEMEPCWHELKCLKLKYFGKFMLVLFMRYISTGGMAPGVETVNPCAVGFSCAVLLARNLGLGCKFFQCVLLKIPFGKEFWAVYLFVIPFGKEFGALGLFFWFLLARTFGLGISFDSFCQGIPWSHRSCFNPFIED